MPAILCMAGIFVVSSIPDVGPLPGDVSDKTGHTLAYAVLALLVLYALADGRISGVTMRNTLLAIVIATIYGASDELHQRFVPGRSPDLLDVRADAIGATIGAAVARLAAVVRAWGILGFSSDRVERS
jgi:VanZ family protein